MSFRNPARLIGVLALPVALLSLVTVTLAKPEGDMATMICRPAQSNETASAKMVATSTPLVCKPFAVSMHMSDGKMQTIGSVTAKPVAGPDLTNALTPAQFNAAYNKWIQVTFHIDPATEHTP